MATREKTVYFAFETLASLANNTQTNLTQRTVYLPDSPSAFRSVTAYVSCDDIVTATGGTLTTKTLELQLAAAGYSSVANANSLTHSGRNGSFILTADYTSYFGTNWSGSSMTCDFRLTINQSTGTTLGMVNVCVTLEITYEYSDVSATQIKTVYLPLNAPEGAFATTGTTYDTIPELDYYLAEGGKIYRDIHLIVEGNTNQNGATTDHTMTIAVGTANVTTGNYEGALGSDRRYRYVWDLTSVWPSKTATQAFQLSDTVGRCNHPQAYLGITYEFEADNTPTTLNGAIDASQTSVVVTAAANLGTAPFVIAVENEMMLVTGIATNTLTVTRAYNGTTGASHSSGVTAKPCVTNSIQLVAKTDSQVAGYNTSSDYYRSSTSFFIEEPGPITAAKIACLLEYLELSTATGLNIRAGTGSFVAYTDNTTTLCGGVPAMVRNDSAFTLARGKNTLTFDIYNTHSYMENAALSGLWMLTYVSAQAAAGHGAHNHTVRHKILAFGTGALAVRTTAAAAAPSIPESDYWLNNAGAEMLMLGSSTGASAATIASVERLSGEGGVSWDPIFAGGFQSDANVGVVRVLGDLSGVFKRYPSDASASRIDIETARRYRLFQQTGSGGVWLNLDLLVTYHSIGPFTVDGSVTGSAGGTVNVYLHRKSDGELLKSTSRTGNGAYPQMVWWDNTETLFVDFYEDGTHTARSADGVGAGDT